MSCRAGGGGWGKSTVDNFGVTICLQFPQRQSGLFLLPRKTTNSVLFHSQKRPSLNDELNGHSCHNAGRIEKHTDGLVKEVVWKLDREVGKARCSKLLEVQRLKK